MTFLLRATKAMVYQLVFQTVQHFRCWILDKLPKRENIVLQYCDKADNIQVNRSKFWGWSKRAHSAVFKVICLFVSLLTSSIINSFHCYFPECMKVYVRILHIKTKFMQLSPPKGDTWNIQGKFSSSLGEKKKSSSFPRLWQFG